MKFFLPVFISLFSFNGFSQVSFQKTYGGTGQDQVHSMQKVSSGGYVFLGGIGDGYDFDFYAVKTDVNGDTLWARSYGGTKYDFGNSVHETSDLGYVFTGTMRNYVGLNLDVYLVKTDINGNMQWSKTYGGSSYESGYSVKQTMDGGYIVAGETSSFGAGNADVYLIKTDAVGDTVWTRTYGRTYSDECYSVFQTSDSGYIVAGNTQNFGAGSWDVLLLKTDANGDTLWAKTYGTSSWEIGYSCAQTADGGFILTGYGYIDLNSGMRDVFVIRTDSAGVVLWSKAYGGSEHDEGHSIEVTSDRGYVIAGLTGNFGVHDEDVCLVKIDSIGNLLWSNTYGQMYEDVGECVLQTSDGGYIISGMYNYKGSFSTNGGDICLIKTDSNGFSGCNESTFNAIEKAFPVTVTTPSMQMSYGGVVGNPATQVGGGCIPKTLCYMGTEGLGDVDSYLDIYPNPSHGIFSVKSQSAMESIEIINILGETIFSLKTSLDKNEIDLRVQPKGIYFCKIILENGGSAVKKVIIQ